MLLLGGGAVSAVLEAGDDGSDVASDGQNTTTTAFALAPTTTGPTVAESTTTTTVVPVGTGTATGAGDGTGSGLGASGSGQLAAGPTEVPNTGGPSLLPYGLAFAAAAMWLRRLRQRTS